MCIITKMNCDKRRKKKNTSPATGVNAYSAADFHMWIDVIVLCDINKQYTDDPVKSVRYRLNLAFHNVSGVEYLLVAFELVWPMDYIYWELNLTVGRPAFKDMARLSVQGLECLLTSQHHPGLFCWTDLRLPVYIAAIRDSVCGLVPLIGRLLHDKSNVRYEWVFY